MYYVFQQQNEASAVLFFESCETEDEVTDLIENSAFPTMFVYDDITNSYSHSNGYYDMREQFSIIQSLLKK